MFLPVLKQKLEKHGFTVARLITPINETPDEFDIFGEDVYPILLLLQSPNYYVYLAIVLYQCSSEMWTQVINVNTKKLFL